MAIYVPFTAGQVLTADQLNTLLITETMEWTNLSSLGSFGSGFTAGTPTPRMRKLMVLGAEEWWFEGRIGGTVSSGTPLTTCFTFSVGNRVAHERGFMTYATSAGLYAMFTAFTSAGLIQVSVPSAAGGATSVSLDGVRITNPSV